MLKKTKIIRIGKYYYIVPRYKDFKDARTGVYYKYVGDI